MKTLIALCIGLTLCIFPKTTSAQIRTFSANGRPLSDPGPGGGSEASGGDLFWTIYCAAEIWQTDSQIQVSIEIDIEGQERSYNFQSGESYVFVDTQVTVHASSRDRTALCSFSTTAGYTQTLTGIIPGAGPNSATIKIDTFIPQNWVGNPWDWFRAFGGDDRGFGYYEGRARLVTLYDVLSPALNDLNVLSGPTHSATLTEEYDIPTSLDAPAPFGRITDQARNDWVWDPPLKTRWAMADTSFMNCTYPERLGQPTPTTSQHKFHCSATASDPIIWAPSVRWELDIKLTWGDGRILFDVQGCHSYWPAMEAYANGVALYQDRNSDYPPDVAFGCAANVSASGVIQ